MFDIAYARSQFPALATPWALFDNAGGSPPLAGVIERVTGYMRTCQVQLGASYALSTLASERVDQGRQAAAWLMNADPDEIVIGPSSTNNVRLLARALQPLFAPGDELVVTDLDHECNGGAWRDLASEGVVVREWQFDRMRHELTLEGLEQVLGPRTRLVCFTHCANVVGTVHDAAAFVNRIHEAGALACVDGVAFAPHREVDVRAIGADIYYLSVYKLFGPHLGLMYVQRDLLRRARSQNHFFIPEDAGAYRLQPGNVVHELAASLPAIGEYLVALDARHHSAEDATARERLKRVFEDMTRYEEGLVRPLLAFLKERRGVRVLGHTAHDAALRVPTVAFVVEGRDSAEIPMALEQEHLGIRYGHFYAYRAMSALGLHACNGVVRASLAHFNTAAEVDRLISALDRHL
ncbi:MAG: aminotransferase class V-fold PLP-dependent enzyme [Candidatus Eisenbacteria bacterium]